MPMNEATATPLVDAWSAVLLNPFAAADRTRIIDTLVELSAHLVPHVVQDAAFPAARQQAYFAARTVKHVEDWLTMGAATQRRVFKLDSPRLQANSEEPALGLRSASHAEIDALPTIGDALADKIAKYLSRHPGASNLAELAAINGIGADRVEALESVAFLETTSLGFISPSLWAFILEPSVANALILFERTDHSLVYGDQNLLERRVGDLGQTVAERFLEFLQMVTHRAALNSSPNGGALASAAEAWLNRQALRHNYLESVEPSNGSLLRDEAYVAAAKAIIDGADTKLSLMVFLGTAAPGVGEGAGPLPLVEAMEAAAARGVQVRVILDQDDGGEPYKSFFINQPLVQRFTASGVSVKFDENDTLLHSKVLVADVSSTIVGSHNWTRSGFTHSNELSVQIENPVVAQSYQQRFDVLWAALPNL